MVLAAYYNRDKYTPGLKTSFVDYIICGTGAIESISFGQEQTFNEILLAYTWIMNKSPSEYDLWAKEGNRDTLFPAPFDGKSWEIKTLRRNIMNQAALYQNSMTGFSKEASDLHDHFETDLPNYFNP
ncbi:MAG: hypothetical protein ACOYL6_14330 [Bacteriovoracaceae bacterium]